MSINQEFGLVIVDKKEDRDKFTRENHKITYHNDEFNTPGTSIESYRAGHSAADNIDLDFEEKSIKQVRGI